MRDKTKLVNDLKEARSLINKGWKKGTFYTWNRTDCSEYYCAVGAVKEATVGDWGSPASQVSNKACRKLVRNAYSRWWFLRPDFLMAYVSVPEAALIRFNDKKDTQKEDILGVFDKTIQKMEK